MNSVYEGLNASISGLGPTREIWSRLNRARNSLTSFAEINRNTIVFRGANFY